MKIALLGSAKSIHVQRWHRALQDRGIETRLYSLDAGPNAIRLPIPPPYGYYLNALALRKLLAEYKPDLLHAHYASGYGTLARLSGISPYMLSVWGSDVYEFPFRTSRNKHIIQKNLSAADLIGSTGINMAQHLQNHFVLDKKTIAITPFGVDTERFSPRNSNPRPITIGTVKTLDPRYGVDILVKAAHLVLNCREDVSFVIFGDGPSRDSLVALAQKLGISSKILFRPAVPHEQVPAALANLDIFVAASRAESFGVAVIEASSCGLPVIVSNVGGLPEVVDDQVTGLIVPSEDPEALSQAIIELIDDPGRRLSLGQNGRRSIQSRYEWSHCVDVMIAAYHQATSNGRQPQAA